MAPEPERHREGSGHDPAAEVEANRSARSRGTPPGRQPTGWRTTRHAFVATAVAAVAATVVLVAVALLG